jgi:NitT/TauT family transport system substrate-binding protein
MPRSSRISLALALALLLGGGPAAAEEIKIGVFRIAASAPLYVAVEKGYFAAEQLDPKLFYFETGAPIAAGVVSGDLDFGASALIAAFYNLAGRGELRLIAALSHEAPGFQGQGYLVSNHAWAQGLTALKDFPGHSAAVTAVGGPAHYALGRLADKYGFALTSMRLMVLQSLTNCVSALVSGQADTTIISMTASLPPLLDKGEAKFLAWVGDETPWQYGSVFTATKTANDKRDMVERFLRAYRKGARDYHDAFTGPDEKRRDGPTAPAILDIIAKYTGRPAGQVKLTITYNDPAGRLDVADVLHQIAWYKAQGMVKSEVDGEALIDKRYVVTLP